MSDQLVLDPQIVKSARVMLQWSQGELARRAGIAVSTLAEFEKGERVPIANNLQAIKEALEQAGISLAPQGAARFALSFYLLCSSGGAELHFQFTPEGKGAVDELLSLFGSFDGFEHSISSRQKASKELKDALAGIAGRYSKAVPHLHRLRKFIQALKDDEFFLLLPERPSSSAEQIQYEELIEEMNNPGSGKGKHGLDFLFGALLERYDMISPRMDKRVIIGTQEPDEKICRFCRKSKSDGVTFKADAHAISAAFGNKSLYLAEECDDCNGYFGREVEPSLIALLEMHLAFLGIQGRGKHDGRPELQFSQGSMFHDGDKVNILSSSVTDHGAGHLSVELGTSRATFTPLLAYKALVKMALSIVGDNELPQLEQTRLWTRYDNHVGTPLPTIATAVINLPAGPSAQMTLYRRKSETSRLPHILGQFQLGPYMIVFAVPFSERDSWNLVGFFDDAEFRETFKHYDMAGKWIHQDLSRRSSVDLFPTLNFKPRTV